MVSFSIARASRVSNHELHGFPQSRPPTKAADYLFPHRFLLKYVSRDEIEIQGHGKGGIVELREAIKQYTELSPLFGYIRYRRRNVLIKFVPDGVSRLVQGKLDRFSTCHNLQVLN
jgi:hypothetical protein